jgi:ubiquinone/menaquinone biosynthesis C-methylase UbiE
VSLTREKAKPALIEILRCPQDGAPMSDTGGEVSCAEGHRYQVVRGVPRLIEDGLVSDDKQRTAAAFGYSWTHYHRPNPYSEDVWREWIEPMTPEDLAGKRVLDAGCGLGGGAEYADKWGAAEVVGADLSEAIFAAQERVGDRAAFVQADLFQLPFPERSFDVVYSIGVLHHTPDPAGAFGSIARMVRPGGLVCAWVYGRENNGWYIRFFDPFRIHVTSRLPKWVNKWIVSLPLAVCLWPITRLARLWKRMPYGDYFRWLAERDFKFMHGVVFDQLVAPTSHYIRREEFEKWFSDAGLENVKIKWRNQNSWGGVGTLPGRD